MKNPQVLLAGQLEVVGTGNACHFGCISAHIRNGITLYSFPQQLLG
jgi:hypothetical protein